MVFLVLFVQFSRKILSKCFTPNFKPFTRMMHFGRTFRFMLGIGVRIFVIEEYQSYGKIVFIKNIDEK